MSGQPIDVAICFDRNIEEPALVFLASLREHARSDRSLVVHVVNDGLSEAGRASLAKLARPNFVIDLLTVENVFAGFESLGHISSGTYLRFMLPELLKDCRKVLYLDVDIIVRRDVADLFDTDLEDLPLAAVPDHSQLNSGLTWRAWRIEYQGRASTFADYLSSALSLDPLSDKPYFNCGVLLLDLDLWRSERIVDKTIQILRNKPGLRFLDQDALNQVIGERYKKLDPRWNALAANAGPLRMNWRDRWSGPGRAWLEVRSLWRSDPWIIHFAGPAKPWQQGAEPTLLDAYWWKAAAALQTTGDNPPIAPFRTPYRAPSATAVSADAD